MTSEGNGLGLLVEAIGLVLDLGKRNHADVARAGCNLPVGGVADALGGEELLLGDRLGGGIDGKERNGAVEQSDDLRMTVVDGSEAERHVERELNPVAVLPGAVDAGPCARSKSGLDELAVDCDPGVFSSPCGDAESNGEALGMRECEVHAGVAVGGVLRLLRERDARASLLPGDARGNVEVDVDSFWAAEVGADAVVGGELREGARATWPLLAVVYFFGVAVVVGVIEADAVGL